MVLTVKKSKYYRRKQKAFLPEADFPTSMLCRKFRRLIFQTAYMVEFASAIRTRKARLNTAMQNDKVSLQNDQTERLKHSHPNFANHSDEVPDLTDDIHREFQEGYRNEVLSEIPAKRPETYSYRTKTNRIKLRILDGMDSICEKKGSEAQNKAKYYDSYDVKKTDPDGSYTGVPTEPFGGEPVQDADDL